MKTRFVKILTLLLATACLAYVISASPFSAKTIQACTVTGNSYVKTPAKVTSFETCMSRYASYFRSFMPFDGDPCNHTPSQKSFC